MLNLHCLEKGLGLVSLPSFVYDTWRKTFVVLYPINEPNLLSDCLYYLRYVCIRQYVYCDYLFLSL